MFLWQSYDAPSAAIYIPNRFAGDGAIDHIGGNHITRQYRGTRYSLNLASFGLGFKSNTQTNLCGTGRKSRNSLRFTYCATKRTINNASQAMYLVLNRFQPAVKNRWCPISDVTFATSADISSYRTNRRDSNYDRLVANKRPNINIHLGFAANTTASSFLKCTDIALGIP